MSTQTIVIDGLNTCPIVENPEIMNMLFESETVLEGNQIVQIPSEPIDGNVIDEAGITDADGDPIIFLSVTHEGVTYTDDMDDGEAGDGIITINVEFGEQSAGVFELDVDSGDYDFALDDDNQFINNLNDDEFILFNFEIELTDGNLDPDRPEEDCLEEVDLAIQVKGITDIVETDCDVFPVFLFGDPNFIQHWDIRDVLLVRELSKEATETNKGLLGRTDFFMGTTTGQGASGPEVIIGDEGGIPTRDNLRGGNSNDYLDGIALGDSLAGGQGNDILLGGTGFDNLSGGSCADYMHGGDNSDTFTGGSAADLMDGGAGNDGLKGSSAADVMLGGTGADDIEGEAQDDIISGDQGNDTLSGGSGTDLFVFDVVDDNNNGQLELLGNDNDIVGDWSTSDALGLIDHTGELSDLDLNGDFRLDASETSQEELEELGITVSVGDFGAGNNMDDTKISFEGGGTVILADFQDINLLDNLIANEALQVVAADFYSG